MTRTQTTPSSGFTLIEMMIVVVIVAILVTVAIVSYTRHIKSTRIVDARGFLANVQGRQEAYFQRFGYYCMTDNAYYPALGADEPTVKTWAPSSGSGWANLGASPNGSQTYFEFKVVAPTPTLSGGLWTFPLDGLGLTLGIPAQPAAPLSQHPWYYAIGRANLDGDGTCGEPPGGGACTVVWTTSARSDLVTVNEGQ